MDGYLKRTEEGKRKISSGLPIALEHCPKVIQDLRNGVANNQRENKKKRSEKKSERVYIYIYTQIAKNLIIAQGNELWDINIGSITIISKTL